MVSPFAGRLALLDERADEFLKTVAYLGGYCSAEQAMRLGIAGSPTRVLAHLRDLERAGFLHKVAGYPLVYQVTKSTTRLLATDLNARRPHPIETVRARLLGVSFYLETLRWPAEFVFDHEQKIALFRDSGCSLSELPQRSGQPYLWEELVLRLVDSRLCVAVVDRYHRSAFQQLWGLAKRFRSCLERLGDRLQLLIAVGSEPRYRLYGQLIGHPGLQRLAREGSRFPSASTASKGQFCFSGRSSGLTVSRWKKCEGQQVARMELTGIVIGFAARKGNGSGLNEVCLVHRPAPDSGNSPRSTKNPARPLGAGDPPAQLGMPTIGLPESCRWKRPSGCGVGRYRCRRPRAVNLAWKHRQIHQKVFSLSLPFPPRPRGWVFGDGFGDRDPSPNLVRPW